VVSESPTAAVVINNYLYSARPYSVSFVALLDIYTTTSCQFELLPLFVSISHADNLEKETWKISTR